MNVSELAQHVATNPQLADRIEHDPVGEISRIAASDPAYKRDVWTYRLVVIMLGSVALSFVLGSMILFGLGEDELPSGLIALGSAAVGALAVLLAPSPGSNGG